MMNGPGAIELAEVAISDTLARLEAMGDIEIVDGRLLIVYGNRQFPFGAQAIASRDGGETWDSEHPIILAWFSWDNYCGHPRSVLLPDGSVVTGYYARVFTGAHEIVLTPTARNPDPDVVGHCLRWRVADDWPPLDQGLP